MYKYLLCWRYLRHRYIALASVVSVMLGVATMIVVNSVMAGFSDKMRERLHGVLADVVVESYDLDGFRNYDEVMARIKAGRGRRRRGDGADDGDVRPDEVDRQRPPVHPAGPDHRHPARGAGEDGRLRRVPLRRQGVGRGGAARPDAAVVRDQREGQAEPPARPAPRRGRPRTTSCTTSSRSRLEEDVPDFGAILGFAVGHIHHPRGGRHRDRPAGDAGRPGLPRGRRRSRSRGTTTSRSSATSRAG